MSEHALPATATPTKRDPHRGRLFRKYLLLILSLVTGALLASGAISVYFSYRKTSRRSPTCSTRRRSPQRRGSSSTSARSSSSSALRRCRSSTPADVELRRIEFLKLLRQAPEVTDIAQLDANGREQIAVSRLGMDVTRSGKDRSQEPAFLNARQGKPWFGPVYFRKETEPYMTIAMRSGSETGPVTIADVNLKFIWDVVRASRSATRARRTSSTATGSSSPIRTSAWCCARRTSRTCPHVKAAHDENGPDAEAMLSKDLSGTDAPTSGGASSRWPGACS